jgi:hypothetical protein
MRCVKAESREESRASALVWALAASLLVAAALALPGPAYPLDDVPGWQTTRWGMTESQVKRSVESLGLEVTPLPGPHGKSLEAGTPFKTTVEIDGSDYDVIFQFSGETHRLGRISIRTLDFSREHALTFYNSLRRTLTEDYGSPGETQSRGTVASTTEWAFKTTTVVLSMHTDTGARAPHLSQVSVTYSPTAAAPMDTKDKLLGLGLLRALGEAGRSLR